MQMRIRVISQTFTDLWRNVDMLNPFKSGFYAIELISHKVLRYGVPLLLTATLISSALLAASSVIFSIIFLLQVLFYLCALAGWLLELSGRKASLLAIPLYFVLANLASVIAFFRFVRGERVVTWETIRDPR